MQVYEIRVASERPFRLFVIEQVRVAGDESPPCFVGSVPFRASQESDDIDILRRTVPRGFDVFAEAAGELPMKGGKVPDGPNDGIMS